MNQEVNYRVHNNLKIIPFLSERNPVHPMSSICILILSFIQQLFRLSGVWEILAVKVSIVTLADNVWEDESFWPK
jgi:hypothetical protein